MTGTKRAAGRPRDEAKGRAILDAGWALFLERGVEATSVEAIAARAGVSKVTLYHHYQDKNALFRVAVQREMDRIEAAQQAQGAWDGAAPLAQQLRGFGLGLMAFLTSSPATDFYTALAGELRRHEALARAFYDHGPGKTRANLAAVIAAAHARGELDAPDPFQAAEHLFGLWQGFSNLQLALGIDVAGIRDGLPERVEKGVAAFLKVYSPAHGR